MVMNRYNTMLSRVNHKKVGVEFFISAYRCRCLCDSDSS